MVSPVQELIKNHKTYFYGVASFYAFFITFGFFLSVTSVAYIIYGLETTPLLWLLLPGLLYVITQLANGFFLFTITYISALLLEHKEVTLQDTQFIIQSFFLEILKLPFFILFNRDSLRRYLSYPHAIFSNITLSSSYEEAENLKEAIGDSYSMLSLSFIGVATLLTVAATLLVYLLPLSIYILFGVSATYTFTLSLAWFYFKTPKLIERTALYIYAKAGRILSPFTFDDLKETVS